ncbi:MAG: heavy metal translocating P-type ATPase [Anaerolineae bacterium]|nr:heavy metal translocating P-type ATPase [Anaerolineae bacterium]
MYNIDKSQNNLFEGVVQRLTRDRRVHISLIGVAVFFGLALTGNQLVGAMITRILQASAILVTAASLIKSGVTTLLHHRRLSIDLLMSISITGAVIIDELPEALTLVVLYNLSEALETIITDNAQRNVEQLMARAPATATRISGGESQVIAAAALEVGDIVLIQPGENIPADGVVMEGESGVDQATITGESIPVWKSPADEVFAGTINGSGALTVQVTHAAEDTMLQHIIHLVMAAQASKSPTQRFIDRFAAVYTPLVAALAALVAFVPPIFFNQPLLNPDAGTQGWLFRGLTLLVIGCPCALVISTPITIISAITRATRQGVIIKGGAYLEAVSRARIFAFDKTGTLTKGQPKVTLTRSIACRNNDEPCPACLDLLETAYVLESRSKHPLAGAVVRAAESALPARAYTPAVAIKSLAGAGISGEVNGQTVVIGSHKYFDRNHPHQPELCQEVSALEDAGQTVMLVNIDDDMRGYLTVQDEIRPEAASVIADLKGMGYQTVILSGDHQAIGHAVGTAVGADRVHAELLPDNKIAHIQSLKERGAVVMVGDGMNDAPALAAADIGISMGRSGSHQAMETADIILMADDLSALPFLVRVSRFANRLLRMNIALSIALKLVIFVITVMGLGSMWLAVLADTGLTILVALNGSRALRFDERT